MARPSRSPLRPTEARSEGPAAPPVGGDTGGGVRRLVVACAAVLLAAADTYVVVLALPSIMRDVGIGLDQLQEAAPIVSGFLCGYVVVLPLLGRRQLIDGNEFGLSRLGHQRAGSGVQQQTNNDDAEYAQRNRVVVFHSSLSRYS